MWEGEGMWGKNIHAREDDWKKIEQRRIEKKKFLQSKLLCRACKLYPPEWHFGSHFSTAVLIMWSNLVESTLTWFLYD